ncbi:MAG: hypothetical protein ABIE55_01565 [Candidatus Aenigmatarchaeota archaeon]
MDGALGPLGSTFDWTKIDALATPRWWTPNAGGDGLSGAGYGYTVPPALYDTFTNLLTKIDDGTWDTNIPDTNVKVKLIKLVIGGSGSWMNETAFVDDLSLNNVIIMSEPPEYWVTQNTSITLDCVDPEPHPVDQETLCYRVSLHDDGLEYITNNPGKYCDTFGGTKDEDWCCVNVGVNPLPIHFLEDSHHNLEYFCEDYLGNTESPFNIQWYYVDTVPPATTKTYEPGVYVDGNTEYADTVHRVILESDDVGDICVIGLDEIYYRVRVLKNPNNWHYCYDGCDGWNGIPDHLEAFQATPWLTYDVPFGLPEESCNVIEYYAVDSLGNEETVKRQCVFYDATDPVTEKSYGEPFFSPDGNVTKWINTSTEITLAATDPEPHPSGVKETNYRVTLLGSNEACESNSRCQEIKIDGGGWTPYTVPFTIGEESCHLIEYYSVDNVDKDEDINRQCVFVEDTAPTILEKTVGQPSFEREGKTYISGQSPITMRCEDRGDHPVDYVSMWYRYRVSDDCATWGPWITDGCQDQVVNGWCDPTGQGVVEKTIYFPQDSCHELEYYCVDALGNEAQHEFEIDVVDNQAPEIEKIIVGPQWGDCPPGEGDTCFVDSATEIIVNASDPEPHPAGEVLCDWNVVVKNVAGAEIDSYGDSGITPPFPITFPEESFHELTIDCYDRLGNNAYDFEVFEADHTSPLILKSYNPEEIYREGNGWWAEWIDSDTEINIEVTDDGDHKSGIKEVKYRYTRQDNDEYCNYTVEDQYECEDAVGTGVWTYVDPADFDDFTFQIPQDSCHLIEIVATDNVDKENYHKQCVYVDNQGPDPLKEVYDPKAMWTPGIDGDQPSYFYPEETAHCWDGTEFSIDCWKVTMMTRISLDCEDKQPHPVDHEGVCFKVGLDGEDATEEYCNSNEEVSCVLDCTDNENDIKGEMIDGWCCVDGTIENFYFQEETEHNLKYYCTDALGNVGPEDEEKFKVEGTTFEIPLYKKWNLISVPFVLLDDDPEVVFNNVKENIISVWAYDGDKVLCGQEWCVWTPGDGPDNLRIIPGWGYWVLTNLTEEPVEVLIGGSLFSPRTTPPSRDLVSGWNLIGYYGTSWELYECGDFEPTCRPGINWFPGKYIYGDQVYCALNSLVDTQEGYPRWSSLWSYISCGSHTAYWLGLNTCADPDSPLQSNLDRMYAGRGYWLELDVADMYAPATTCLWNSDYECRWSGGGIIP